MKTLIGLVVSFLAVSASVRPVAATNYDVKTTSLYGIRLGMSADDAIATLHRVFPRQKVAIFRRVCERDYLVALRNGRTVAKNRCVTALNASNESRGIWVGLVEDVLNHRYGHTVVTFIQDVDNSLKTDADVQAFRNHAYQKYGVPDYGMNTIYSTWCNGKRPDMAECQATDGVSNPSDDKTVRADMTPYGYCSSYSAPWSVYTIGVHSNSQGVVNISDNVTPGAVCYQFSQLVNPQTSKPNF